MENELRIKYKKKQIQFTVFINILWITACAPHLNIQRNERKTTTLERKIGYTQTLLFIFHYFLVTGICYCPRLPKKNTFFVVVAAIAAAAQIVTLNLSFVVFFFSSSLLLHWLFCI